MQLTLPLLPQTDDLDLAGRTEIISEACPHCRSPKPAMRIVSTRVMRCRLCSGFAQRGDDGRLVVVPQRKETSR